MNQISIHRFFSRMMLVAALLLASGFFLQAQDTLVVSGTIVSPEFKPVPNVSVSVEGSRQMPAFTNEAGEFSVKTTPENKWIIVAPSSDYKRKRIFLNNRFKLETKEYAKGEIADLIRYSVVDS